MISKVGTMNMSDVVCVSHGKDTDGLASAALVKIAKGADVILADYGDFVERLMELKEPKELYICDLGLNESIEGGFLAEVKRLTKKAKVIYIDHHPLDLNLKNKIKSLGVALTHSTEQCASMLVLQKLCKKLPKEAGLLAAYGAVTDYMDNHPSARKIVDGFDRQFVIFESTLLSHAISGSDGDTKVMDRFVDSLASLRYPHQIEGIYDLALKQVESISQILSEVRSNGVRLKNLAYMETDGGSTGNVANLLTGSFEVPVGIAYKLKKIECVYEASLRGTGESKKHLGKVVGKVAKIVGGSGGGHPNASGIRFPKNRLTEFLRLVEEELEDQRF